MLAGMRDESFQHHLLVYILFCILQNVFHIFCLIGRQSGSRLFLRGFQFLLLFTHEVAVSRQAAATIKTVFHFQLSL